MRGLTLVLLAACQVQAVDAPEARPEDAFRAELTLRALAEVRQPALHDPIRQLVPDGVAAWHAHDGAWLAPLPYFDVMASADADGVRLGDSLRLHTTGWGRGQVEAVRTTAMAPGACVTVPTDGPCVQRLEARYADPSTVSEWWTATRLVVEQAWTVDARPPGDGPLVFEVAVDGGVLRGDKLVADDGPAWRVQSPEAFDARGADVPITLVPTDDGFALHVDDTGAVYPIVVDPIYAPPTQTLTQTSASAFGGKVENGGDLNADGFEDLLVVDAVDDAVYVYLGASTGLSTTPSLIDVRSGIDGVRPLAGGQDLNGDGFDDFLVGRSEQDRISIFKGTSTGPVHEKAISIGGSSTNTFGESVVMIPDTNDDGFAEFGALDHSRSRMYSCHGGTGYGDCDYSRDETTVTIDGSSRIDWAVFAGRIWYVVSLPTNAAVRLLRVASDQTIDGTALRSCNDTTSPTYGPVVGLDNGGERRWSTIDTTTGRLCVRDANSSGASVGGVVDLGTPVSMASGDIDGDGITDIVVGSTGFDEIRVVRWFDSAYSTTPTVTTIADPEGLGVNSDFGSSVAMLDIDGDGADEVVVGAGRSHKVYVFYGDTDADLDGYGSDFDCDDANAARNPGATEIPGSGVDENCDGNELCYQNLDGDSHRTSVTVSTTDVSCTGTGHALASRPAGDCNDNDPAFYPGAPDTVADGVDNDCDGSELCYRDGDFDGARSTSTVSVTNIACSNGNLALASAAIDCDDGNNQRYPGNTETVGDGVDNDCDNAEICYENRDGDGYRTDVQIASVDADCDDDDEALRTRPANDCNDDDATIFPGASEAVGEGIDRNCDGQETCYVDADDDGYRTDQTVTGGFTGCGAGRGLATDGIDCRDDLPEAHPGALDPIADGIDGDCDGIETCFLDADLDGAAKAPPRFVVVTGNDLTCTTSGVVLATAPPDCDDQDAGRSPFLTEIVGDEIDQDCDLVEICYQDDDHDGHRTDLTVSVGGDIACDGEGEAPATMPDADCDDADATIYPGAPERVADGIDSDCDTVDFCYQDLDGDGFRTGFIALSTDLACTATGFATATVPSGDCDDASADTHPGAEEVCDTVDSDCDGSLLDELSDVDSDGVCDGRDLCAGDDASGDSDDDGTCDDLDGCWGDDAAGDSDGDGVCDDLDACLGDDAVGDPERDGVCVDLLLELDGTFARGEQITLSVRFGPPDSRVPLVYGLPGSSVAPCGSDLDLAGPRLVTMLRTDAFGEASFTVRVPQSLPTGQTLGLQAVVWNTCAVSNPLFVTP
ncbi:MAG: hypothetical protein H6733_04270 [Alphaproteobacteria bacterium]|nr:hypothetical protein [Alphaproteobacteria bacterium]